MRCNYFPTLLAALAALSLAPACSSGGGDDDDDTVDARPGSADANPNAPDATISNPADAAVSASMVGDPCTQAEGWMSQGSCSAGFACVGLGGGAGAWCTKACTGQSDTVCQTGYTGPGYSICLLTVQDPDGTNPDQAICVVMCQDTTGANICPTCDGTCPSPLVCNDTGNQWSGCW